MGSDGDGMGWDGCMRRGRYDLRKQDTRYNDTWYIPVLVHLYQVYTRNDIRVRVAPQKTHPLRRTSNLICFGKVRWRVQTPKNVSTQRSRRDLSTARNPGPKFKIHLRRVVVLCAVSVSYHVLSCALVTLEARGRLNRIVRWIIPIDTLWVVISRDLNW